jgi:beta-glucosidase
MGWRILPQAFTDLLVRVHRDYPDVPITITENGCAYPDGPDEDGRVRDDRRIDYLHSHLAAVHAAIQAGADIRGYYLWSFLDNFEWALGYSKRFGIVHVDYDTLVRTPKDSARWYADVVAANALPA